MDETNSRRSKKEALRRKKSDKLLNILIVIIIMMIAIASYFIFSGKEDHLVKKEQTTAIEKVEEKNITEAGKVTDDTKKEQPEEKLVEKQSDDPIVEKEIVDPTWQVTPTTQENPEAAHVSVYKAGTVDWEEKMTTLQKATGIAKEQMTVWRVKNGGANDTSIGIVSTKDKSEMYRVTLEWQKGEGWKATKMEVLKQLEGSY